MKWGQKHETKRSQVVCDQSKVGRIVLHKMAKMPNGGKSCQELMVKSGVARFRVSQFARKETKGSPMVGRFLLHDPYDMSIRGVSGKRKFCIWVGMLEGYRRCREGFCILECLLCRCGPLQCLGPPLPSGDQLKGATPVRSWGENDSKNLPCRGNVATA